MATLLIDRRDMGISADGGAIRISHGERTRTVPMALMDRVVIQADIALSSRLLTVLARRGIPVIIANARRPEEAVAVIGGRHGDAARRLAQYRLYHDAVWRSGWSARLIDEKLKQQRLMLFRAATQRNDLAAPLRDACARIEEIRKQVRAHPQAASAQVMGWEGAAAAAYFRAYRLLFPPSLGFLGRNRRPPRDPVNVCLSLSYTLVHYQAVGTLLSAGLDPYIGFYHELDYGRESLAADLVEVLRPRTDAWVWELFRERWLRPEHFSMRGDRCLIGKAGRRTYYESVEPLLGNLKRHQRRLSLLLVRALSSSSGEDKGKIAEAALH